MSEQQCNTLLRLHSKSILCHSIEHSEHVPFYDVCFEVGSEAGKFETIKAFKSFFASQSSKFHQILFQETEDHKDDSALNSLSDCEGRLCVRLLDLQSDIFSFLHKLFYGLFDIRMDRKLVVGLMNAAKAYNITHLWDCCFQYILSINFQTYSSSFFYILHQTQIYKMERECIQIIDCLQPISEVSEFAQFFNDENKGLLSMLCRDIIIYLLFFAKKFDDIQQEYIWNICVFWAQNHSNRNDEIAGIKENDTINYKMASLCPIKVEHESLKNMNIDCNYFGSNNVSKDTCNEVTEHLLTNDESAENDAVSEMQYFVQYFNFSQMDWSFFIDNVYKLRVLSNEELIRILSHYVLLHSHIILRRDRKKRKLLPDTKFVRYVRSQKLFVDKLQINEDIQMAEEDIIVVLVQFIRFNTNSIDNKQKEPLLYGKWDAISDKKHKNKPFFNAKQSKETFEPDFKQKHVQIVPSECVESLHPILCQSIEDKLASIMFSQTLSDVTFRLRTDQSTHYGIRALFAMHSKVFHAMLYTNFVERDENNEVHLDNVDQETFQWILSYLYGLRRAVITRYNVIQIYCFSDTYLMITLRSFALKFICWMYIDHYDKATDFLSIITQLHKYQADAFWKLFISQINEDNVSCSKSEADIITNHPQFNTLPQNIITPFLFQSGLFRCYSPEIFWRIIVKWCASLSQRKDDLFLQQRLKPFLSFFVLYQMDFVQLDSEGFLVLIMNVKSFQRVFQSMKKQTLSLRNAQNIIKNSLFVSLPLDLVHQMMFNFMRYHNVPEQIAWKACIKWCRAQRSWNLSLNQKLKSFVKDFEFHTMSIRYFQDEVVSRNVLTEYEEMSVYERFCDYHGVLNTINNNNVVKLCKGANKHSLNKLEVNCLKYVAAINVAEKSSAFLRILLALFRHKTIRNFIPRMSQYLRRIKWTKSQCLKVINNQRYFYMLTTKLVELLLFKCNQFNEFTQEELWTICVKWSNANCNNSVHRNEKLRNFVNYFQFEDMQISFFRTKVENLNVLTDSESMEINRKLVTYLMGVIQQKNEVIRQKQDVIENQQLTIAHQNNTIRTKNNQIAAKNREINGLYDDIRQLKATINRLKD